MPKPKRSALAPIAARTPSTLTIEEQGLSGQAIDTFVTALGGRAALTEALAIADSSADVDKIVTLLLDPRYDGWSLRRICEAAGLTIAELLAVYKKAAIVQAHVAATPIIARKLIGVVDDVMTRAQPYEVACPICSGVGTVPPRDAKGKIVDDGAPEPCRACKATGRILALPDLERQKVALELGQLVTKGGGINLIANQQNNFADKAGSTSVGALEQMQQAVGELLYGRGAVLDGETVPPAGPDAPIDESPAPQEPIDDDPSPAAPPRSDLSLGGW